MQRATYSFQVIQAVQLRAQTAVNAEKLFVHDRSQRQRTERIHTSFVNLLRVFVLALQLESEIVCQMPTLMVAT